MELEEAVFEGETVSETEEAVDGEIVAGEADAIESFGMEELAISLDAVSLPGIEAIVEVEEAAGAGDEPIESEIFETEAIAVTQADTLSPGIEASPNDGHHPVYSEEDGAQLTRAEVIDETVGSEAERRVVSSPSKFCNVYY